MTARQVGLRVLLAAGVLWAAYTVSFIILYLVPGDPVAAMAAGGMDSGATSEEDLNALREEYGFNDPLLVQYFSRLGSALTGDFGTSVQTGQPVISVVFEVLGPTLQLAGTALVLALLLGSVVAIFANYTRSSWLRSILTAIPPVSVSLPTFWIGLVLIQVFSFGLGWFPAMGDDGLAGLVLPAVTLALPVSATIAQVMLSALDESASEQYVVTAQAKGLGRLTVELRHILRNSLLPVLSMIGLIVGNLLAGSVIVETVFSRPGIGQLTVESVTMQDLPVIQGIVVLAAVIYVVANLVVDLVLPKVDPRVKVGQSYA